ncbi:MAG: peptidoglycan recognition protein family protein [Segniliparus sp.]|uniref:peptidoglycan recognition protein family protein n=1 Tax=Segniliparus sp. TaxID=2804064 RepID=UPI003F3BDD2E
MVTRSEWAADESIMTWEPQFAPVQAITVHHTGELFGDNATAEAVRDIYRFHALPPEQYPAHGRIPAGRGWGDIGYQLLIGPDGAVYAGRATGADASPVFQPGTTPAPAVPVVTAGHVYNYNPGNIGICLLGNFETSSPTPAAVNALTTVLASLTKKLALDPLGDIHYSSPISSRTADLPVISGHRDWPRDSDTPATECPGTWLEARLPLVRQTVAAINRCENA